jgi:hypothetical protein
MASYGSVTRERLVVEFTRERRVRGAGGRAWPEQRPSPMNWRARLREAIREGGVERMRPRLGPAVRRTLPWTRLRGVP